MFGLVEGRQSSMRAQLEKLHPALETLASRHDAVRICLVDIRNILQLLQCLMFHGGLHSAGICAAPFTRTPCIIELGDSEAQSRSLRKDFMQVGSKLNDGLHSACGRSA